MNLWFEGPEMWSGIGDYIQVGSVIGNFQAANPLCDVSVAYYPWEVADTLLAQPGVDFYVHLFRPEGAIDAFRNSDDRRNWYSQFDIEWDDKRLYYSMFAYEKELAERMWSQGNGKRVMLQWRGGNENKFYDEMDRIYEQLISEGCEVIILDPKNERPNLPRRVVGTPGIRKVLALAATSELYIGFDSGPMYAALGNNVPAIGFFPNRHPEELYYPLVSPKSFGFHCPLGCNNVPLSHVQEKIDQFLDAKPFTFDQQVEKIESLYTKRHAKALYGLVRWLRPEICLEVGSFRGYTTAHIAQALEDNHFGELISIDEYGPSSQDKLKGREQLRHNMRMLRLGHRVKTIAGRSQDVEWPSRIDFAFIDGDHNYDGVSYDVRKAIERGAKCIALHDSCSWAGVKQLVEEFENDPEWGVIDTNFDYGMAVLMKRFAKGACELG